MAERFFREIERSLDENSCVTSRTLAAITHSNVQTVQSYLSEYLKLHNDVHGLYLISGVKNKSFCSFCFVEESNLGAMKKQFEKIESMQLYSIHRPSSSTLTQASALDIENFQVWDTTLLTNSIGNIQLSGIQILPKGQRPKRDDPFSPPPSKPATLPRVQSAPKQRNGKEDPPEAARSFFDKRSTSGPSKSLKPAIETRPPLDPKVTSTEKKTTPKSSKPKQATKSESSNPLIASEDEDDQSQKEETNKSDVEENQTSEDNVDEDEWEEGGFNTGVEKYVLNKEKIQKRDEIQSINNHFAEDANSEEDEDETSKDAKVSKPKPKKRGKKRMSEGDDLCSDEEEKKTKKSKKKITKEDGIPEIKIQIHGAMDDFFEDMAKKHGDVPVVKKKRTKLVEKVFADEKGYLVTEMVYEEVSENEPETSAVSSTLPRSSSSSSTKNENGPQKDNVKETKKKANPKQASTAPKGQQRSMMSYFTKK